MSTDQQATPRPHKRNRYAFIEPDAGGAWLTIYRDDGGMLRMRLPETDPGVPGALWYRNGVPAVSKGFE